MEPIIVLEQAKKDMQEIINETNLSNIEKAEKELADYFVFLKTLTNLRHSGLKVEGSDGAEKEIRCDIIENVNEIQEDIIEEDIVEEDIEEQQPMYLFERKLRGGFVSDVGGYVQEAVVRELGLEDGDYVYAEQVVTNNSYNKRFNYTLAKVGERKPVAGRIQINYGIVTEVAGRLAVESFSDGSGVKDIRVDGMPYTVMLNEDDVRKLNIKKGSIIDLAYFEGCPEKHKIIWSHQVEGETTHTIEKKALTHKVFSPKLVEIDENVVEKTLSGRTVLIIGDEPNKRHYKSAIEARGGLFLWADGKDNVTRLEAKVKKSDQVIFLLKVSGHKEMDQTKKLCKQYNVPFDTVWSKGASTATRMAEERISV